MTVTPEVSARGEKMQMCFLVAVVVVVGACSANDSAPSADAWGPLAVVPPQDGADSARTEGTLRITNTCVFLETPREVTLLFWPSDRTRWRAEPRTISFTNFDGRIVTVRDGDHVVLGGGGDSQAESGVSGEEWLQRMEWVAPPSRSCSLDQRWAVGAVGR